MCGQIYNRERSEKKRKDWTDRWMKHGLLIATSRKLKSRWCLENDGTRLRDTLECYGHPAALGFLERTLALEAVRPSQNTKSIEP